MAKPDLSVAEGILHNLDKAVSKTSNQEGSKPKVGKAEAAPAPRAATKGPSRTASNFKHTRTSPRGK
jgi:hypothetical protein